MAFTNEQYEVIKTMMNAYINSHRPPAYIRAQLDIGWRMENQTLILYEIRPDWTKPSEICHIEYAKAVWVERQQEWHIYWLLSNMKWLRYEGLESTVNLQRFLIEVEEDPKGCFHG